MPRLDSFNRLYHLVISLDIAYAYYMSATPKGFTIVEILVVLTTMGILLAIGFVSWGAYTGWSQDRARESDAKQWASTFDLYKSRFFVYPVMPSSAATPGVECLGAVGSFPTSSGAATGASKCGQFKSSAANTFATSTNALSTAVTKISALPKNSHEDGGQTIYEKTLVGPIAYVTRSADTGTTTVTARFIQFFKGGTSCPNGFTGPVTNAQLTSTFPSLQSLRPSGVTVSICYLQSTTTISL